MRLFGWFLLITILAVASGLAQPDADFRLTVCPSSESNPRNSEGDIVVLKDGSLLLAWTRFQGREDHDTAVIAAKKSTDQGRTWGEDFVLQENFARQNVMSVSLLRIQSDKILLFFLEKNADDDLQVWVRASEDEAKTWNAPQRITQGGGYHIVNNARVIQLRSGRILVPIALTPHISSLGGKQRCFCYYSDDDGVTWHVGAGDTGTGNTPAMEPGLVQLKDGRVMMIIRTVLDRIYQAYSGDGGLTWSDATAMDLVAPAAPATISRVPWTGDLLMVWNNNPLGYKAGWQGRSPLTTALSRDEGKTWEEVRDIESIPQSGYGYT
ncbi:MAG: sialidase family protein, partial [bacterium]|nr:sialidase family protein [bacterium]